MFSIPFNIEKSIEINKSKTEVFQFLGNFMNWPNWSPWLSQEPDCDFSVEGNPGAISHKQSWSGAYIGAGNMVINEVKENQFIGYDLEFLKPWKSKSKVEFVLTEGKGPESTLVTWKMIGSLPFFMFFFKKMMHALVGNDYDRGLSMLKEHLETGQVNSKVIKVGLVDQKPV